MYPKMEKRLFKRKTIHLNAMIISGGKTYDGYIENVSEGGVEYLMTSSINAPYDFTPETVIELIFQIPSGKTLHLYCEVKWFLKASLDDKKLNLGIKVIDPPPEYIEFVKTLNIVTVN